PVESELEAAEAGPRPGLDVRFGARGARQQEQRPRDGPHPIMMAYFALPAPSATLGCAPCLFWQRTRKPILAASFAAPTSASAPSSWAGWGAAAITAAPSSSTSATARA